MHVCFCLPLNKMWEWVSLSPSPFSEKKWLLNCRDKDLTLFYHILLDQLASFIYSVGIFWASLRDDIWVKTWRSNCKEISLAAIEWARGRRWGLQSNVGYVIYDLRTIVKHLAFPLRQEAIKGFCVLYLSKNRNREKKKKNPEECMYSCRCYFENNCGRPRTEPGRIVRKQF